MYYSFSFYCKYSAKIFYCIYFNIITAKNTLEQTHPQQKYLFFLYLFIFVLFLNSFDSSVLTFVQLVAYKWQKSSWILDDVVIESILCDSNEKLSTVWSLTACVESPDNVISVFINDCLQLKKKCYHWDTTVWCSFKAQSMNPVANNVR